MDRFTLWEKAPSGGWQPAMTYPAMAEARDALDAFAGDFLPNSAFCPCAAGISASPRTSPRTSAWSPPPPARAAATSPRPPPRHPRGA